MATWAEALNAKLASRDVPCSSSRWSLDTLPPEPSIGKIANIIRRFGTSSSNILLDERCRHFEYPGIEGIIGYKQQGRYVIALGDPACAASDRASLLQAFRAHCRQHEWRCIYAVIGSSTASPLRSRGCGLVEFGVEQVLDPCLSLSLPGFRDLRKKLKRARRAGVHVAEYCPRHGYDAERERQLDELARCWLMHREGLQTYWASIDFFRARAATRWFCGTVEGKVVGALSMLKLEALDGYLLEHIVWLPDAPVGTSESLVVQALENLAAEGCGYASFGPAPAHELGEVSGFSAITQASCRFIYKLCRRALHLDSKMLYRQKYRPTALQPLYLAFDPAVIRPGTLVALGHAFNVSMH